MPRKFLNLDANESIFFENELTQIMAKVYETKYPELKAVRLIPVDTSDGDAAETIGYDMYDEVGVAKIISSYADDLPRADVKGKRTYSYVKSIGTSYGYNIQEVRGAARARKPLVDMKAKAARKANDMTVHKGALFARGEGDYPSLYGLIYNANITSYKVVVEGSDYAWADKSASAIITDINTLCNKSKSLTSGVEIADTFLCPVDQMTLIATTKVSDYSDTTILDFVKKANPHITLWEELADLKDVNPIPSTGVVSNTDIAICYKRDPEKLSLRIPQPFEQFPVQERNLEYVIPCHSRFGGVIITYPLSITIAEGI
ncbi:MAG: hypothetical protein A2V66_11935 [Ignavibacteria bacterium RBG_13_36_8]|nr:MAG: hypothetical protein A2V66_11935 [Ignavibacteria bacterium RBG_13_36_8]